MFGGNDKYGKTSRRNHRCGTLVLLARDDDFRRTVWKFELGGSGEYPHLTGGHKTDLERTAGGGGLDSKK